MCIFYFVESVESSFMHKIACPLEASPFFNPGSLLQANYLRIICTIGFKLLDPFLFGTCCLYVVRMRTGLKLLDLFCMACAACT